MLLNQYSALHWQGWEFAAYGTGGSLDAYTVPDPTTMAVVVMGMAGFVARRRRRRLPPYTTLSLCRSG